VAIHLLDSDSLQQSQFANSLASAELFNHPNQSKWWNEVFGIMILQVLTNYLILYHIIPTPQLFVQVTSYIS